MRFWTASPALFLAAVGLTLGCEIPEARAQEKLPPPVAETFNTADGVKLHGLFHKSPNGEKHGNAVVVMLYSPGAERNMTKGDWDGLANALNREGFHVFRFDWRGHGKSTDITDTKLFWENPITGQANLRYIKGSTKKPVKNDLFAKEIDPRYFPIYATDLAAVRTHLDQKNDQGDLNTSSIYIVGAGDTASLGFLWLTAEWLRPSVHPVLGGGQQYKVVPTNGIVVDPEAGRDFAGAIWLSGTRPTNVPVFNSTVMPNWVKNTPKLRDNNPMLFLYGPDDKTAGNSAGYFFNDVLVAKGNKALGVKPLEQTFVRPLDNAKGLNGVALLGNNDQLKTEDTIVKYLAAIQKERVTLVRIERKYIGPYFIDLRYFLNANP